MNAVRMVQRCLRHQQEASTPPARLLEAGASKEAAPVPSDVVLAEEAMGNGGWVE